MTKTRSLEEKINLVGNAVKMLRNGNIGKHAQVGVHAEFSTWMEQQQSWREDGKLNCSAILDVDEEFGITVYETGQSAVPASWFESKSGLE